MNAIEVGVPLTMAQESLLVSTASSVRSSSTGESEVRLYMYVVNGCSRDQHVCSKFDIGLMLPW